jgi:hypothetical protein
MQPTQEVYMRRIAILLMCGLAFATAVSAQGFNYGGQCYLSWSRDATVRNIDVACGDVFLYLKLANIHEVKGVEFGLYWVPDETSGGFVLAGVNFPTSAYGTCTYLLRGTVITVVAQPDDGSSYAIAAAGSGIETACTFGNVAVIDWDFSPSAGGCATVPVSFMISYCKVTDHYGTQNTMEVIGSATILGATPTRPATWGAIKALYH